MKQILLTLGTLCLLLLGCSQAAPAETGDVLIVTDGTTEKRYQVDDLRALQTAQAAFADVTYTGVPLSLLLADAGFDAASLSAVKATARDGFSANYDAALITRPDTLVAYAQADGPLTEEDGTFRMVLPDQEGRLNPRDLVEILVYP